MSITTEQQTVVKGGSICIFGASVKGIQWCNAGADFLLCKFASSNRYKSLLCLNVDRSQSELTSLIFKSGSVSTHNPISPFNEKINFVNVGQDKIDLVTVLKTMQRAAETSLKSNDSFAFIIYSLSELILNVGMKQSLWFVSELLKITQNCAQTLTITPAVVFVVHESLHSLQTVAHIQSLVSTVVRVVPNSGTLSPEVAAEIQTVRKSPSTGKVSESVEMFAHRDAMLWPIPSTASNAESSAGHSSDIDNTSAENVFTQLLGASAAFTTAPPTKESLALSAMGGSSNSTARLITFDSTDPEFDNDSDPDADLDL